MKREFNRILAGMALGTCTLLTSTYALAAPSTPAAKPTTVGSAYKQVNTAYTMNWSAVSGATSYELYSSATDSNYAKVYSGSSLTSSISGSPKGYRYYKYTACDASGCSDMSPWARLYAYDAPIAPRNINASPIIISAGQSATLSWDMAFGIIATGAEYRITQIDPYNSYTTLTAEPQVVNVSHMSRTVYPTGYGTSRFQVKACNPNNVCGPTSEATVTVEAPLPGDPANSPTMVRRPSTLAWEYQQANTSLPVNFGSVTYATSYQLYVNGSYYKTSYTASTTASFGTGYNYLKYLACNNTGCSGFSPEKRIYAYGAPNAMTGVKTTLNGAEVSTFYASDTKTLSWDMPSAITYEGSSYLVWETNPQGNTNISTVAKIPGVSSQTTTINPNSGGLWKYQVQACNPNNVCGGMSAEHYVRIKYLHPKLTNVMGAYAGGKTYPHDINQTEGLDHGTSYPAAYVVTDLDMQELADDVVASKATTYSFVIPSTNRNYWDKFGVFMDRLNSQTSGVNIWLSFHPTLLSSDLSKASTVLGSKPYGNCFTQWADEIALLKKNNPSRYANLTAVAIDDFDHHVYPEAPDASKTAGVCASSGYSTYKKFDAQNLEEFTTHLNQYGGDIMLVPTAYNRSDASPITERPMAFFDANPSVLRYIDGILYPYVRKNNGDFDLWSTTRLTGEISAIRDTIGSDIALTVDLYATPYQDEGSTNGISNFFQYFTEPEINLELAEIARENGAGVMIYRLLNDDSDTLSLFGDEQSNYSGTNNKFANEEHVDKANLFANLFTRWKAMSPTSAVETIEVHSEVMARLTSRSNRERNGDVFNYIRDYDRSNWSVSGTTWTNNGGDNTYFPSHYKGNWHQSSTATLKNSQFVVSGHFDPTSQHDQIVSLNSQSGNQIIAFDAKVENGVNGYHIDKLTAWYNNSDSFQFDSNHTKFAVAGDWYGDNQYRVALMNRNTTSVNANIYGLTYNYVTKTMANSGYLYSSPHGSVNFNLTTHAVAGKFSGGTRDSLAVFANGQIWLTAIAQGASSFSEFAGYSLPGLNFGNIQAVTAGDFKNAGNEQVAVLTGGVVKVYQFNGSSFSEVSLSGLSGLSGVEDIDAADVDGNGVDELVANINNTSYKIVSQIGNSHCAAIRGNYNPPASPYSRNLGVGSGNINKLIVADIYNEDLGLIAKGPYNIKVSSDKCPTHTGKRQEIAIIR
jgi:hypothetical protein